MGSGMQVETEHETRATNPGPLQQVTLQGSSAKSLGSLQPPEQSLSPVIRFFDLSPLSVPLLLPTP